MKKNTFITAINALDKQMQDDEAFLLSLSSMFCIEHTNGFLNKNVGIIKAMLYVLKSEMQDFEKINGQDSLIEWFCFTTNFGMEKTRLRIHGKVIIIDSPEKLYDLLIHRNDYYIKSFINKVKEFFKIDFLEKTNKRELVWIRQSIHFLLKEKGFTLQKIADSTNIKAHATILHSLKEVQNKIDTNDIEFLQYFNKIRELV